MALSKEAMELAERGKKLREERAAAQVPAAPEGNHDPYEPNDLAARSIGSGALSTLAALSAAAVGCGVAVALTIWLERTGAAGHFTYLLSVAVAAVGMLAAWLVHIAVVGWSARREVRRLRAVPFLSAAVPWYLEVMDVQGHTMALRLEVWFRAPPPRDLRQPYADMVTGCSPQSTSGWDGDTLVLQSPQFSTRRVSNKGGGATFTNARVHAWFQRILRRCLLPMHQGTPIGHLGIARRS